MHDDTTNISPAGRARRDAILRDVLAASRSRRRRRAVTRAAGLMLPVIGLAAAVWAVRSAPAPITPRPIVAAPTSPTIQIVATQAGIADRWSARPAATGAEQLDDENLFLILKAEGRATGLVRTEGRVTVVGFEADATPRPSGMIATPHHSSL